MTTKELWDTAEEADITEATKTIERYETEELCWAQGRGCAVCIIRYSCEQSVL